MYKEMLPLIYNLVTQWYSSKKGRINVSFLSCSFHENKLVSYHPQKGTN